MVTELERLAAAATPGAAKFRHGWRAATSPQWLFGAALRLLAAMVDSIIPQVARSASRAPVGASMEDLELLGFGV
jgi:hypothetical protein